MKHTINENTYEFQNTSEWTRNGFRHVSVLLKNGEVLARETVNYINRTWESYQFKTSMSKCIDAVIESEMIAKEREVLAHRNWSRFPKGMKAASRQWAEERPLVKDMRELKDVLNQR